MHPLAPGHERSACGCAACGGIWLDMTVAKTLGTTLLSAFPERAAAIVEQQQSSLSAPLATDANTDRSLPCPVCGGNLGKHRFPPLETEVDRCLTDGMFFDRGELATIVKRASHRGKINPLYELDAASTGSGAMQAAASESPHDANTGRTKRLYEINGHVVTAGALASATTVGLVAGDLGTGDGSSSGGSDFVESAVEFAGELVVDVVIEGVFAMVTGLFDSD
jgi:Zn-finger nucleic acid-binding protein